MSDIVFGCIVPHPPLLVPGVGRGQERAIRATTDAMAKLADDLTRTCPDTLVLISPHGIGHSSAGSIHRWVFHRQHA
ncbi:MAG: hypothetical protein QGI09_08720 [Dehalococcoidia bacterium]|nr:hypothetical protein [Dehalococcoidia bacterium]